MVKNKYVSLLLFIFLIWSNINNISKFFIMDEHTLDALKRFELTSTSVYFVIVPAIISTVLIIIPPTFTIGCVMNASILFSLATIFLLKGNFTAFFIELLFIAIPLILVYLGYPIKLKEKIQKR